MTTYGDMTHTLPQLAVWKSGSVITWKENQKGGLDTHIQAGIGQMEIKRRSILNEQKD